MTPAETIWIWAAVVFITSSLVLFSVMYRLFMMYKGITIEATE